MSPDQWLDSQPKKEKTQTGLSPDQWLATQKETPQGSLSPDEWLAKNKNAPMPDALGRYIAEPAQEAKTSNPFKGLLARASNLAGEGVEAVARVAENLGDKLETALPLTDLTPEQIKNEKQLAPMFQWADALRNYGKDIGYAPSTQLGEIPGNPLNLVPFIAERVISSAPDMAAAVLAAPAYVMARTNEILNDRLSNDKKSLEDATVGDVTAAVGAAVLETTLERFATKSLFKGKLGAEASTGARRIGKETAVQSGTEAVEEGIGYLGGTAGTQKGVDAAELAQNMLEGAIVGGGLGAGIQGGKEYFSKKERAELADTIRSDLEAKGETPTDEQVGAIVDKFINERKRAQDEERKKAAEEAKPEEGKAYQAGLGLAKRLRGETDEGDTETRTDAGRTEPSVPISEQQEAGESATGTTTPPPGSVGGDTGPTDTSGVGEGTQQGALTRAEAEAKIQEFQAKKAALLTKTGKIPLANSKKGKEYQALVAEEEAFIKARENAPIIQSARNDFKGEISRANLQTAQNLEYTVGKEAADVYLNELKRLEAAQNQESGIQLPSDAPAVPTTPEFEAFFQESKVRDDNGRMIPLYHGTTATNEDKGISQFKVSKEGSLGEGVYLTPQTDFANTYSGIPTAEEVDQMEQDGLDADTVSKLRKTIATGELVPGQVGSNVLPVFADLRNPLIIRTDDRARDPAIALLEALGVSTEKAEAIMEKAYENKGGLTKEVSTRARKLGYDGIMQYKNGVLSEVVAFSPLDIKSAMNQKPTRMAGLSNSESSSPRATELLPDDVLNQGLHPEVEQAINNNSISDVLKFYSAKGGKFISAFAKRLQELNLTTSIYFNNEEELSKAYIDQVKGQRDRFYVYIQTNYPNAYKKYFEPIEKTYGVYDPQAINKLAYYFTHINNNGLIVERNGVKSKANLKPVATEFKDLLKVYRGINSTLQKAAGTYFGIQDAISLNTKRDGDRNYVAIHEITHAATHFAINNPSKLNAKQTIALGNLNNLYIKAKKKLVAEGKGGLYGLTDLHEFVSEAFSNKEFQAELRKISSGLKSDPSVWSKFIQFVAQLVGSDNVLFHTMANADVIFSANNSGSTTLSPSSSLSDQTTEDMPSVSYGLKDFKLNPGERGEGGVFGFIRKAFKGKVGWKDVNKETLGGFLTNVNDNYRQYLLGGLTLDQLTDMAGEDIPQFKSYVREVDAMIATRNKIMAEGDKPIKAWTDLIRTNPTKAEELSRMMIEATINKVDPDPKGIGHNAADLAAHPEIQKAWNTMTTGKDGDVAKQIYREVRGFYEKRMDEYVAIQQQRLIEREQAKNTDPKEIDTLVIKQREELRKDIIQPYFPIKRFGEYWVQLGTGKGKTYMQFENAGARNAAINQMRSHMFKQLGITKNSTAEEIKEAERKFSLEARAGEGFTELSQSSLSDVSQLGKLKERIDAVSADVAADPNAAGDEINTLRDALKDSLDQYVLEITPNQSIRKMFLHRNNIQGASQDMLRAFAESRYRIAYQRSRFEHMPKLFEAVEAARAQLRGMPYNSRTSLNRALVRELELNLKAAVLEPPQIENWVRNLTQFGFLHYLTSPASAVVNMMAIPGIYIPFARARFGLGPVTSTLAKYTALLGGSNFVNEKTGRLEFLSLARSKLGEMPLLDKNNKPVLMDKIDDDGVVTKAPMTYADAYEKGVLLQAIDTTLSHESASIGDQPSENYTGRWQKFMYYASLPFHAAEKFNRETTYMTTFELAYNKYINDKTNPYTPEAAFEKASQDARDLVQKTMFNYNTINKPRYFRGNIASMVLQFKMYPQQMSVLLARTFYQSMGSGMKHDLEAYKEHIKNSPDFDKLVKEKEAELKQVQKEATEAFWGTMGMTFLTAGMSGLPLFFIISGIGSAFHAAFGEDDEPYDFDNWFKNWCSRTFGGMVGDSISRGVLSQVTGMNFADRMSLNMSDMWFPNVKKSQDEVQYLQNVMTNLMGPVMGAGLGYAEAVKRLNDGHYERAAEAMLPAGLKNIFVGTRYMVEGKALTLKGDTIDSHISAKEAVGQMLGFAPEDTAQKQKAAMEKKNFDLEIVGRQQDLKNAFFIAFDSKDSDMQKRVTQKMMRFNKTNPEYAIKPEALISSIRKRYEQRVLNNMAGGVSVNKKAMARLAGMSDYAKD
jgi:hypothetical protein